MSEPTEFERLAAVVQEKRQRYQCLSMMNTFGLTPAELASQEAAFVIARAEMWKAEADLQCVTLRVVFGEPSAAKVPAGTGS